MLRQFHGGIEGAHQAVLHDTHYGQGAAARLLQVLFHGQRHSVARQVQCAQG
ncbi:MAG: hypothetical protein KKE86_17095 [Planctomycetes bacterium]|nr:hypothetical protein [Planctomycetota bacterium]MBU4401033.1 hypothetical protein [Planctomycetota bacterium]MCG2684572.1 hypothetical protein [Planctomycetales bacterium]